ncbi:hypothetical protein SKAU_G00418930 [Synaphobranchus kaupii]|uniref:Ig-like domain-containing protein n=1 Tax=Synaphobranchus kaupii TaxID=118154 RepID=A0A9Q1E691_SYNKA|nr:hypothetical protein SKAU_G00418930 [Synaphobranchus kaupii]
MEVMEGTSVSLSCSAAAPCPKLPPNLTWTPSLSDSVDQLQKNEDQTESVSSVLTFTASHLHHGQKITCRALYKLQQGDIQKTSNTSLTLRVLYMPQITGSGSCSRTAAEISCSCESRGNPSPSMEWRVSGLRVTKSTDKVISEEQLGNTGLRSSLTMRHSQGDTPTLLCLSTNTLGSSSLRLHVPSPQQHSESSQQKSSRRRPRLLQPRHGNHPRPGPPELGGTDPQTLPLAEGQIGEQLEGMHYASIKHSPPVRGDTGPGWGCRPRGRRGLFTGGGQEDNPEGKVEDGAGQGEERLVVGASMETESLCVEIEKKKEMEGIPECEYSNVVFKKKDVQP